MPYKLRGFGGRAPKIINNQTFKTNAKELGRGRPFPPWSKESVGEPGSPRPS